MKWLGRGLLIGCLWSTTSVDVAAQVSIGVRGGFTSATMTGEDLPNTSRNSGFTLGGFVGFGLTDAVGLDLGTAYTQKGVEAVEGGTSVRIDLGYLQVPALVTVKIPSGGALSPRVSFGPVLAWRTGCDAEVSQLEVSESVDCGDPALDGELDIRSFDIGALVGAGVIIGVGSRTSMTLDAMYNFGVRSIDRVAIGEANRNRTLSVTAGLSYAIGIS